ncbi:mechanosensitive ion channel, partial [Candidatus Saccharibacteria bacterium]|nr:mechanosensitive ion channel [Candidatus Saccharibacteria bacterium]
RDGNVHIVPNGSITEVINRTLGYSKFRFTFAVDVGTNVDDIIKVVNQTGEDMARDRTWSKAIVDAPHYDEFGTIGKEGINVTVSGTTMPGYQWKVSAEFRKRLVSNLQKSDISIADLEG